MQRVTLLFLIAFMAFAAPVSATSFDALSDSIEGYRILSNKPPAPELTFMTTDGELRTLQDYAGKTVLLNLWATWCPPCIKEMPALNDLASTFKDQDFVVVAVAVGRQGRETPDGFLKRRNLLEIKSYLDPAQDFLRLFHLQTLPASFLIDADGNMQGGVLGMTEWNTDDAKTALHQLLGQDQAAR